MKIAALREKEAKKQQQKRQKQGPTHHPPEPPGDKACATISSAKLARTLTNSRWKGVPAAEGASCARFNPMDDGAIRSS